MAVFRVEKTGNFTVMSNHHLRDKRLSLKAKGLLSQILSLPDTWDYSLRGLSCINRESVDAVREAVRELERAGYVVRTRQRDDKGCLRGTLYSIYEHPRETGEGADKPQPDVPALDHPVLDSPAPENPVWEKATQLKKEETKKEGVNTEETKKENSVPSHRIESAEDEAESLQEKALIKASEGLSQAAQHYRDYEAVLRENIEYDVLRQDNSMDPQRVDELLTLMVETVCTSRESLRIAGNAYPAELVRARFMRIGSDHIRYVCACMDENTARVRNIRKYLLAALFNAPATLEHYYTARVNYDFRDAGQGAPG